MVESIEKVLVTGGAGYVGSVLVPKLVRAGYETVVLDLYLYGDGALGEVADDPLLTQVKGDIRDRVLLERVLPGCDAVIHLACISNDPSFELDPDLGKTINYDAFFDLVDVSRDIGVRRFVYASSSSVYGIKAEQQVTEELALEPLTDYSKYKALCEDVLLDKRQPGFAALILRPATICGYGPRLRLDLTVNILTAHAQANRVIKVFGGSQKRPNLHIQDMTDLYVKSLQWPSERIDGKIYNVGQQNHRVAEIAEIVRKIVGEDVEIVTTPSDDLRSYHISSAKIEDELGFRPSHNIEDAVGDLLARFDSGAIVDPLNNSAYYNIKTMQEIELR